MHGVTEVRHKRDPAEFTYQRSLTCKNVMICCLSGHTKDRLHSASFLSLGEKLCIVHTSLPCTTCHSVLCSESHMWRGQHNAQALWVYGLQCWIWTFSNCFFHHPWKRKSQSFFSLYICFSTSVLSCTDWVTSFANIKYQWAAAQNLLSLLYIQCCFCCMGPEETF